MKHEISGLPSIDDLSPQDQQTVKTGLAMGTTRRQMMGWLMASGATIAAAGSIVSSASQAVAATPKKGGSVKMVHAIAGPNDTFDLNLGNNGIDYTRGRAHYNGLCQTNEDLTSRPELAEEFSSNADNTEWTFKLRKGVVFHDGSPFTADDALFTMNRHLGDDTTSGAKSLVSGITEWVKIDEYTIKAVLSSPDADLPAILGLPNFKILKNGTTDFQNPVGTGPFKLADFTPGVRSLHVRNDDYWRDGPNVDEIEIFAITDAVARMNALMAGDVDMITDVSPRAIKTIESTPGVGMWSIPGGAFMGICALKTTEPGNNNDFVLALKYLQRREKIVKSILKGQGVVGNDHPISAAYGVDHCEDIPQREHDLDKAKFHLQKSGVTTAEIKVAEVSPGITDVCLLAQAEAAKIGLDLKVTKVPSDGYWGAIWQKAPMNVTTYNMRPTANIILNTAFAPDAPYNDTFWKDERIGTWLKDARSAKDPAKRKEIYCAIETLVRDENSMVIPAHVNYVDAKSDKIEGIGRLPLGAFGGGEWPEYVWRNDV